MPGTSDSPSIHLGVSVPLVTAIHPLLSLDLPLGLFTSVLLKSLILSLPSLLCPLTPIPSPSTSPWESLTLLGFLPSSPGWGWICVDSGLLVWACCSSLEACVKENGSDPHLLLKCLLSNVYGYEPRRE